MGNFDLKYAAYERAMQQHNYFGLRGEAIGEQLGRYAEALQYKETKEANRSAGREFGRQLAAERRALSQTEQNSLSSGLNGEQNATKSVYTVQENVSNSTTSNDIWIADKMKVGTSKKGFKYYLVDAQGQVYEVDKKAYKAAQKGKAATMDGARLLEPKKDRIPEKIKKVSEKVTEKLKSKKVQVPKHNYNIITDPQAYNQQRADMYEKLWGNFSHPSNTPLGSAKPTKASGVRTWKQVFEEIGTTYNPPKVTGILEAEKRAEKIINGNETKRKIGEILNKKTEFNPANLEKWSGHAPNPTLQAMNDYYRELEKQPTIQTVTDKIDDLGKVVAKQGDNIERLGKVIAQQNDKIDDLGKVVAKQGDKIDDLAKKLAKTNKKVAVIAAITAAAAGTIGYLLGSSNDNDGSKKEQVLHDGSQRSDSIATTQVSSSSKTGGDEQSKVTVSQGTTATFVNTSQNSQQNNAENVVVKTPVSQDSTSVEQERQKEVSTPLNLKNGKYITQKYDSFWNIAERYLEEKYSSEPGKYKNLSQEKQNAMIQKEAERIMKLNGYWYDSNHNFPEPMLNTEIKVVVENLDKAA